MYDYGRQETIIYYVGSQSICFLSHEVIRNFSINISQNVYKELLRFSPGDETKHYFLRFSPGDET
jgi:hypothetical protein